MLSHYVKQRLIVTLLMLLSVVSAKADVFLWETFSSSDPVGWRMDSILLGTAYPWTTNTDGGMIYSASGGYYFYWEDDHSETNKWHVYTQTFDLTGRTGVTLWFETIWRSVEGVRGTVDISNDSGLTWTTLYEFTGADIGQVSPSIVDTIEIDVTAEAANQEDVIVRFTYDDGGSFGKDWYIDGVRLYSDVDLSVNTILDPLRLSLTNCGPYTNAEDITVRIHNYSPEPISAVPVEVQITGGINVTLRDTFWGQVPGATDIGTPGTYDFLISGTSDMSVEDYYNFTAFTSHPDDKYHMNDTHRISMRQTIQTYPFDEDFESGLSGWYLGAQDDNAYWTQAPLDVTYLNGEEGYDTSWFMTVDQSGSYHRYLYTPIFDLSSNSNAIMEMDIKHLLSGANGDYVRVEYNTGSGWIQLGGQQAGWYNTTSGWGNSAGSPVDSWTHYSRNLCELSGQSCVQFRFHAYLNTVSSQFAVDSFRITQGFGDDFEPYVLLQPEAGECTGLTAAEPYSAVFFNNSCIDHNYVPYEIIVTGDNPQTIQDTAWGSFPHRNYTTSVPGRLFDWGNFNLDLSTDGIDTIRIVTKHPDDLTPDNDTSIYQVRRHDGTTINTFPHTYIFDNDNEGWASYSTDKNLLFVNDSLPYLGGEEARINSWYVDRVGYPGSETIYVESPPYDLSTMDNPTINMDVKARIRANGDHHYFYVQYSTGDDPNNWKTLNNNGESNFYNTENGWRGTYTQSTWDTKERLLCDVINGGGDISCVKFRVVGQIVNFNHSSEDVKFAFDQFEIKESKDVGMDTIWSPVENLCLYGTDERLVVAAYNYGCKDTLKNVLVGARVKMTDGRPDIVYVDSVDIPSQDTALVYFMPGIDMTPEGTYEFIVYTSLPDDRDHTNDTLKKVLIVDASKVNVFDHIQGFENSAPDNNYTWKAQNGTGNIRWLWTDTDPYQTRDTYPPALEDEDADYGYSWYLDVYNANNYNREVYLESPVFDFTGVSNPKVEMDIKYKMDEGSYVVFEYSLDGGITWDPVGSSNDWYWYNHTDGWSSNYVLDASTISYDPVGFDTDNMPDFDTSFTTHMHHLCMVANEPCVVFRFRAYVDEGSAIEALNDYYASMHESVRPDYEAMAYFALDSLKIIKGSVEDDVSPREIILPTAGNCDIFTANEDVGIVIENYLCDSLTNIPVTISITDPGGASTTYNQTITDVVYGNARQKYTFNINHDMTAEGLYDIKLWTHYTTDSVYVNDTIQRTRLNNACGNNIQVTNVPFFHSFDHPDSLNEGWRSNPDNAERFFTWGELPYLNGPQGQGKCLYTDVRAVGDGVYVESPIYDMSAMSFGNPVVQLDYKYQLFKNFLMPPPNHVRIQFRYKKNCGDAWTAWKDLPASQDPDDTWYIEDVGWWSSSDYIVNTWTTTSFPICELAAEQPECAQFRVYGNMSEPMIPPQFAFDNFGITEGDLDIGVKAIPKPYFHECMDYMQPIQLTLFNTGCGNMADVPVTIDVVEADGDTYTIEDTVPTLYGIYTAEDGLTTHDVLGAADTVDMFHWKTYTFNATTVYVDSNSSNDATAKTVNLGRLNVRNYPAEFDFDSHPTEYFVIGEDNKLTLGEMIMWALMCGLSPGSCERYFEVATLPASYLKGSQGHGNSMNAMIRDSWVRIYPYFESPRFDTRGEDNLMLSFDAKYRLASAGDTVKVQYSTDGGSTWTLLGDPSDPNWYNTNVGWRYTAHTDSQWVNMKYSLCDPVFIDNPCIIFRVYASGNANYTNRFAVDNFAVKPPNVEVVSFIRPEQAAGCIDRSNQEVELMLYNWGCVDTAWAPLKVNIMEPGGSDFYLQDTCLNNIPTEDSLAFTLGPTFNMNPSGTYYFYGLNEVGYDTTAHNVTVDPKVSAYPYQANFNGTTQDWRAERQDPAFTYRDFQHGSVPYLGGSADDAWYLSVGSVTSSKDVWVESPLFDMTSLDNPYFQIDVKYQMYSTSNSVQIEYSVDGGATWSDLGSSAAPEWYNSGNWWRNNWGSPVSEWQTKRYSACEVAGEPCVKFRVYGDIYHGTPDANSKFAFDNIRISEYEDLVLESFDPSVDDGCLYSETEPMLFGMQYWGCNDTGYAPIYVDVNGPVPTTMLYDSVELQTNMVSLNKIFDSTLDMTVQGTYYLTGYLGLPGDDNRFNDTLGPRTFTVDRPVQVITLTSPYKEKFNVDTAGWKSVIDPVLPPYPAEFEWGPVPYLGGPDGYGSSWYVDFPTDHASPMWVESPVFDLSASSSFMIMLDLKWDLFEDPVSGAGLHTAWIDYSFDGGATWNRMGSEATPEWYNYTVPSGGVWAYPGDSAWHNFTYKLCGGFGGQSCVKFRVGYFGIYDEKSNFAFDNFQIIAQDNIDARPVIADGCFGAEYPITVQINNNNNVCTNNGNLTEITLHASVNGGPVITETVNTNTIGNPLSVPFGGVQEVYFNGVTIPDESAHVRIWTSMPNGAVDPISSNDTIIINQTSNPLTKWPACNDHCSEAYKLESSVTQGGKTAFADRTMTEDAIYRDCFWDNGADTAKATFEASIWYYFETTPEGGPVTVEFTDIICRNNFDFDTIPDDYGFASGIQVAVEHVPSGFSACDTNSYQEQYCYAPPLYTKDSLWNIDEVNETIQLPDITYNDTLGGSETYYIMVDPYGFAACDFYIELLGAVDTLIIDAQPDTAICEGDSVLMFVSGVNKDTATVLWSNGVTTDSMWIAPSATTEYFVTVTQGLLEKVDSASVFVSAKPTITLMPSKTNICEGDIFPAILMADDGLVPDGDYLWNTGETSTSINVLPTVTTMYYLTVTPDTNICADHDSVEIVYTPTNLTVADQEICDGETATLEATLSDAYIWSTGDISRTVNVSPTTTTQYHVTVTQGPCNASGSAYVTVHDAPTITAAALPDPICSGESTTMTASGGVSYQWNTGSTANPVTVSPPISTAYMVTGWDANGCSNNAFVNVTVDNMMFSVHNDKPGDVPAMCIGDDITIVGFGATSYLWSTGNSTDRITVSPTTNTDYTVTATKGACEDTYTTYVTVNSAPPVAITVSHPTICDGFTTTLTASGADTYAWGNGLGTGNPKAVSPASTTAYSVTGTVAGGCSGSDMVTVTVNANPTITVGPDLEFCQGGSVSVTAPGGFTSYSWSSTHITQGFATSTPGPYTVTVTDANGCQGSDGLTVTENANPFITVTAVPPSVCGGVPSDLTATGASTYLWSTAETDQVISVSPMADSDYFVTGTDLNGCIGYGSITVAVTTPFTLTVTTNDNNICLNDSFNLKVTGAPNYTWSTGATADSIWLSPAAGAYYGVTGTDAGCKDTAAIYVSVTLPPTFSLGNDTGFCSTDTVLITGPAAMSTYLWNTGATDQTVKAYNTTTYSLTVTNAEGCEATDGISTTRWPLPTVDVNVSPADSSICIGNNATMTATGAISYIWSNAGANPNTVSPATSTEYYVTGTSGDGCTNIDSVTIVVDPLPVITATSNPSEICPGGNITLTATGAGAGGTYYWSNALGFGNPKSTNPASNTTYTVTGTDANACVNTAQTGVTVVSAPAATITADQVGFCYGDSARLEVSPSASVTITWSNMASTSSIYAYNTGDYSVTVVNAQGCESTASEFIEEYLGPENMYITVLDTNTVCPGGTATIKAVGASTYQWSHSLGTGAVKAVSPLTQTTYSVTGTHNGCIDSASYTVSITSVPTVSVTADLSLICPGEQITLTAAGADEYQWVNDQGTTIGYGNPFPVYPQQGQTYTVYGTVGNSVMNCIDDSSVTVSVRPVPIIAMSPDTGFCPGGNATVRVTTDDPAHTISWVGGVPNNGMNVTTPGYYQVTVTNVAGCQSVDSVYVSQYGLIDSVHFLNGGEYCYGDANMPPIGIDSSHNNATYYVYMHADSTTGEILDSALLDGNGDDIFWTEKPDTTGRYYYTAAAVTQFGCRSYLSGYDSLYIYGLPQISGQKKDYEAICTEEPISISAPQGDYTYTWKTGETTRDITVQPIGSSNYAVTVTDSNNCSAVDMLFVPVFMYDFRWGFKAYPEKLCLGQSAYLSVTSSSSATYSWSNEAQGDSIVISPSETGVSEYSVTMTYGDDCKSVRKGEVEVFPNPEVYFMDDTISVYVETPIELSPVVESNGYEIAHYIWRSNYEEDQFSDDLTFQMIDPDLPSDTGLVSIVVVDVNGCVDTAYINLEISDRKLIIYNMMTPNNDGYNDYFKIENIELFNNRVSIYNRNGHIVYETSEYEDNPWFGKVHGADKDVPDGVYFYVITLNNTEVKKGTITVIR